MNASAQAVVIVRAAFRLKITLGRGRDIAGPWKPCN